MGQEPLPLIRPMLAVNSLPFDSDLHLFEVKWDGYRGLLYLDGNTSLRSRNLLDLTGKFPELGHLHQRVARKPAILDGEVVVFEKGKPSFTRLQARGRLNNVQGIKRVSIESPAVYIAFDVLYAGGKSVMERPLRERKALLAEMVKPGTEIIVPDYILHKGRSFFDACVSMGLEGVVAKKLDSIYLPGRRSTYWQKFRHTLEADLVICGYQTGASGRKLGSLILGGYREGKLVYQGKVGTGFNEVEAAALLEGLHKIETDVAPLEIPLTEKKRTHWVRPLLVCSIDYLTTTREGYLRHPVYRGIRWDKAPEECPAVP
ncbi:MAG TPA: non-homologous end-joining DNA ligase [Bacillota bacterium]|nr:non-homologous end-joining DNA ligase [Peptococcaceae bacterium MAG4]HPU35189.1 non-homologous end-joining DNA ligase [Bacillota bacterium]HPZ42471.1 non-homologous end-joining DNA ligase [Bacillota bacterium]HQD75263.1 non-homologous end-joining DNA ligase [Bacillota bacterium]HUM57698.1 non-homologous end-joining DNA ligase [Bacillota bacterium]